MQIVIDINDKTYERIKYLEPKADTLLDSLMRTIQNGKSLPKGHGRLIDADRLKIDNPLHLSLDIPYVTEDTVEDIIDYAPTIIEADKEVNL